MYLNMTPKNGNTARCLFTLLFFVFVFSVSFSNTALAQLHGAGVLKACDGPIRSCQTNLDCDSGNVCEPNICDTTIEDELNCQFAAVHIDQWDDVLELVEAYDTVDFFGTPTRWPTTGNSPISDIQGNAVCTAAIDVGGCLTGQLCIVAGNFAAGNAELPCEIGADGLAPVNGIGQGIVVFDSSGYTLQPDDLDDPSLWDQAVVKLKDQCTSGECTPQTTATEASQTIDTDIVSGCIDGSNLDCDDNDVCTPDSCDPVTGCSNGPRNTCDDSDACTADSCDAETGCVNNDISASCDDSDACTADSCDPATGCVNNDISASCDDSDACTADSCDPATGCVNNDISASCDDSDACTADSCDPATGCVNSDISASCDDSDACTADSCDPATGCVNSDISASCDDSDACTADSCDPATGCVNNDISASCDDSDACTADSCDPATGCVNSDISATCDDSDPCTADSCDPATGCVNTPIDSAECTAVEICRTPGFWATHGGDDKNRSQNITQLVIDGSASGYLSVCGEQIDTTDPNDMWSTSNAMCTAVKGVKERQLVRQLTAMALNCVMSGGDGDCSGTTIDGLADECNALCAGAPVDERTINDCISEIDCFNNGGAWDGNSCIGWMGSCSESGLPCDANDASNCVEIGEVCSREPSCHDLELCQPEGDLCFSPPGPAGGMNNCKLAKKNGMYLPE